MKNSSQRTITFATTIDPAGLDDTLNKIGIIGGTVDFFDLAAITTSPGGATVKLLSKDRSVLVKIGGEDLNREVAARLNDLGLNGTYNHRTGRHHATVSPGDHHSVSSKTKLGKLMKYLGADPDVTKAFRKATASNMLRITDTATDDEAASGVTRVEVFEKDDRVQASWDAVVEGVDLNVNIRCTAVCQVQHRALQYSISFDYDRTGPLNVLREMLSAGGFEPFDGDIE